MVAWRTSFSNPNLTLFCSDFEIWWGVFFCFIRLWNKRRWLVAVAAGTTNPPRLVIFWQKPLFLLFILFIYFYKWSFEMFICRWWCWQKQRRVWIISLSTGTTRKSSTLSSELFHLLRWPWCLFPASEFHRQLCCGNTKLHWLFMYNN